MANPVEIIGPNGNRLQPASDGSLAVTLSADTDIIGKVGVDQTTPGTTNGVAIVGVNAATALAGNGATGTGSLRVTIASDSTGIVALPAAGTSVVGTKAAGTAAATSALIGGVYNATAPAATDGQQVGVQADQTGAIFINNEGRKASYRAVAQDIAQTAAGVFFQIQGSGTKTIRVTRVTLNGQITTAVNVLVGIYKSSATNTGTSSGVTPAKMDSGSGSATATVITIATPTGQGSSLGYLEYRRGLMPTPTTAGDKFDMRFGDNNGQGAVLRGTGEFLGLYVATDSGTYTGAKFDAMMEWTEE